MKVFYDSAKDCEIKGKWRDWLADDAIPLWSNAGVDKENALFRERLNFDATPCDPPVLRLMPQMRQIASFADLSRWTVFPLERRSEWAALARDIERSVRLKYRLEDGWAFGICAQSFKPVDTRRDLYAHAFVLFAYGKLERACDGAESYAEFAMREAENIERLFRLPFADGVENAILREWVPDHAGHAQNPYMHLLEAYIEWAEITGAAFWKERVKNLSAFLKARLIGEKKLVLEQFDSAWRPIAPKGFNRVEPGHLCEWSYLLGRAQEIIGADYSDIGDIFEKFAVQRGICKRRSLMWDSVAESGKDKSQQARLWPQTEFLRMRKTQYDLGADNTFDTDGKIFAHMADKLFKSWIPRELNGMWFDRLNDKSESLSEYVPATSFYHLVSSASAWLDF